MKRRIMESIEKLDKRTVMLIAFFFGVGLFCFAAALGAATPFVAKWMLAHPRVVVKAMMGLSLLPVFWLLGRPVARLLERR
jgi:cadmium resistance protein CadD (predicted permease)